MGDFGTGKAPCLECARLREEYARATAKREWAKADLISAGFRHDPTAIKAAHLGNDEAVHEWEAAYAALQEHIGTHGDREELEKHWDLRVKNAELRLQSAQQKVKKVFEDFPLSEGLSSDGDFAQRQALQAENLALAEYRRVMRIYTDLVVYDRIPDDAK